MKRFNMFSNIMYTSMYGKEGPSGKRGAAVVAVEPSPKRARFET
jgi:hypothetical protein